MVARAGTREPLRTCVGCRQVRPKGELIRLVRSADGSVSVDPTATAPGRGAYVCPESACADRARKRLSRALRTTRVDPGRVVDQLTGLGVR